MNSEKNFVSSSGRFEAASIGAKLTRAAARVTRPGSRAAQARACGPPPVRPSTANLSSPSQFAIALTSGATSATVRASSRSERPYPGRRPRAVAGLANVT